MLKLRRSLQLDLDSVLLCILGILGSSEFEEIAEPLVYLIRTLQHSNDWENIVFRLLVFITAVLF